MTAEKTERSSGVRLHVGGLARGVGEEELAGLIARALPEGASAPRAEIMRDASTGVERGFAFVDVPAGDGVKALAEQAIAAYDGTRWRGNRIKVGFAKGDYMHRLRAEWEEQAAATGARKEEERGTVGPAQRGSTSDAQGQLRASSPNTSHSLLRLRRRPGEPVLLVDTIPVPWTKTPTRRPAPKRKAGDASSGNADASGETDAGVHRRKRGVLGGRRRVSFPGGDAACAASCRELWRKHLQERAAETSAQRLQSVERMLARAEARRSEDVEAEIDTEEGRRRGSSTAGGAPGLVDGEKEETRGERGGEQGSGTAEAVSEPGAGVHGSGGSSKEARDGINLNRALVEAGGAELGEPESEPRPSAATEDIEFVWDDDGESDNDDDDDAVDTESRGPDERDYSSELDTGNEDGVQPAADADDPDGSGHDASDTTGSVDENLARDEGAAGRHHADDVDEGGMSPATLPAGGSAGKGAVVHDANAPDRRDRVRSETELARDAGTADLDDGLPEHLRSEDEDEAPGEYFDYELDTAKKAGVSDGGGAGGLWHETVEGMGERLQAEAERSLELLSELLGDNGRRSSAAPPPVGPDQVENNEDNIELRQDGSLAPTAGRGTQEHSSTVSTEDANEAEGRGQGSSEATGASAAKMGLAGQERTEAAVANRNAAAEVDTGALRDETLPSETRSTPSGGPRRKDVRAAGDSAGHAEVPSGRSEDGTGRPPRERFVAHMSTLTDIFRVQDKVTTKKNEREKEKDKGFKVASLFAGSLDGDLDQASPASAAAAASDGDGGGGGGFSFAFGKRGDDADPGAASTSADTNGKAVADPEAPGARGDPLLDVDDQSKARQPPAPLADAAGTGISDSGGEVISAEDTAVLWRPLGDVVAVAARFVRSGKREEVEAAWLGRRRELTQDFKRKHKDAVKSRRGGAKGAKRRRAI